MEEELCSTVRLPVRQLCLHASLLPALSASSDPAGAAEGLAVHSGRRAVQDCCSCPVEHQFMMLCCLQLRLEWFDLLVLFVWCGPRALNELL